MDEFYNRLNYYRNEAEKGTQFVPFDVYYELIGLAIKSNQEIETKITMFDEAFSCGNLFEKKI